MVHCCSSDTRGRYRESYLCLDPVRAEPCLGVSAHIVIKELSSSGHTICTSCIFTCGSRALCDSGCHPRYSPRTSRCERDEMTPAAAASRMPKGSMAYTVKMMKRKKDTWRRVWGAEGPGCAAQGLSLRSTFPPQALGCEPPHLVPGAHHTSSEQESIAQSQQCNPYEARKRSCPSLQLLLPGSEPQ